MRTASPPPPPTPHPPQQNCFLPIILFPTVPAHKRSHAQVDIDIFDIVIGTDFLRRNPQVKLLSLQRPYALHCDFGRDLFSVPLDLSGRKESCLRYVNRSYRTENSQLVRPVLENELAALQVDMNEVQVELFASKKQHLMQLYCSQNLNNAFVFTGDHGDCAMLIPHSPSLPRS